MPHKQKISNGLLISLIVLENLFLYVFFKNDILSTGKNAIGLFISSFLFGFVLIYKFYNSIALEPVKIPANKNLVSYVAILAAVGGMVALGVQYSSFFPKATILHSTSDIIPCIQIACRRLLSGQYPYKVITDFGYDQTPNYFPMHWMPYSIAEALHIDYRWVSYGAWCIAATWLCIRSSRIPSAGFRAMIPLFVFASFYVMQSNDISILEITVELLISSYYMMLIVSLNQPSGIFQGIIISFCMLSRFSIVLWLQLYSFILVATNNRKQLYTAVITAVIMVVALYVIPFWSKDWGILMRGFKYYDQGTYAEWVHLNRFGQPLHLFRGTGFAYYFYTRFANLDIMARIKLLQRTQLISSLLITTFMGVWFWYKKEKIDHKIFMLSSFKIYLALFLFLIQVPYGYLMCVGNFVSIAIFCEQARYRLVAKTS